MKKGGFIEKKFKAEKDQQKERRFEVMAYIMNLRRDLDNMKAGIARVGITSEMTDDPEATALCRESIQDPREFPMLNNIDKKIPDIDSKRPSTVLVIMDGWGVSEKCPGNAITAVNPMGYDYMVKSFPVSYLQASGEAVGLPDGQMGNSEVGHANIGAGRVIFQDLMRINNAIRDGSFAENETLVKAVKSGKTVHLLGLLSDGGVHSHINHLFALLELCAKHKARTRVHCFLDGRDVQPGSSVDYVKMLEEKLKSLGGDMKIASVSGRYYAMDRDKRWERLSLAYAALTGDTTVTKLSPVPVEKSALEGIEKSIKAGETDEFVKPFTVTSDFIGHDDSVIFYNYRPDRAREITSAFVDPEFYGFERENGAILPHYVCMTQYDEKMPNVSVAYPPEKIVNNIGEWLAKAGKTQFRCAETEKYAHVTFFFNNGKEDPNEHEERRLLKSPDVATYDLKPEMSAYEVYSAVETAILKHTFDFIVVNFANCDMVGHTGNFEATKTAVATVDKLTERIFNLTRQEGGVCFVTADHGNADKMLGEDGKPFTAHTCAPVPFIVSDRELKLEKSGKLCDIAPTILDVMGLPKPPEMTGKSLIIK